MSQKNNSILNRLIRESLQKNFTPYSSAAGEMGKKTQTRYLNANENPYPFAGLEGLERYDLQQPAPLVAAMADTFGITPQELVVTRGSDESIDLIIRVLCESRQDSILICPPTFGMYQVYAGLGGVATHRVPLIEAEGTFFLGTDAIIQTAKEKQVKVVFICYPNAPSGTLFDQTEIETILEALKETCAVVIDEAYIDFTDRESFTRKRHLYPNMLILRTLSKAYALAGERVGCTISADIDFLRFLRGCLAPYPIAKSVAENAVKGLTLAKAGQAARTTRILKEQNRLFQAYQNAATVAHIYPSVTNFLLVKFTSLEAAQDYLQKAAQHHIVLRDVSKHPDTPFCLRISVGNEEENDILIKILGL